MSLFTQQPFRKRYGNQVGRSFTNQGVLINLKRSFTNSLFSLLFLLHPLQCILNNSKRSFIFSVLLCSPLYPIILFSDGLLINLIKQTQIVTVDNAVELHLKAAGNYNSIVVHQSGRTFTAALYCCFSENVLIIHKYILKYHIH